MNKMRTNSPEEEKLSYAGAIQSSQTNGDVVADDDWNVCGHQGVHQAVFRPGPIVPAILQSASS